MSIASYSELKTSVANWLNRSDLTAYIPDFVALGEARIYRELRIRAMETPLSSAISSGVVAVPSTYMELKHAYVDGSPTRQLLRCDPEYIYSAFPTRASTSKPSYIAREGSNFIFGPYPDSAYTIKGIYYARLTALSDANTTNWFTTNAPGILLWAALCEAEPFLKNDQRVITWQAKYEQEKDGLEIEEKAEQFSGGGLAITVR